MLKKSDEIVSDFLSLNSKTDLSDFFSKELRTINYLLYVLKEDDRYETFSISKRSGDTRVIRSPIKPIKDLQKVLSSTLLEIYKPRKPIHGFVKNRSIISNAKIHKNKRWIFRTDIDNFFPSINFGRVRGLFLSEPFKFNVDIATLLSQLCTFKNK